MLQLCLSLLALLAPFQDASPTRAARRWPHETSDIAPNARIRFGRLDNGLRYAWMANAEPRGRCYLRLAFDVGSWGETDDERGMAHFLEHMAFNGSRNFQAGELIKWFQRHGMSFGADTNAFTADSLTVYMLDLPNADEESLREGLRVFRDYADGLLLEQTQIDAEKGVIDGEEREWDSPEERTRIATERLIYDGTRKPLREIIGVARVRQAFTSEALRAFYRRWYRPDNATLIAVGDFGERDPSPLFEAAFADWRAPDEPLANEPAPGTATLAHPYFAVYEPEIPYYVLSVQRAVPVAPRKAERATLIGEVPREIAHAMLNLRFDELSKAEDARFLQAFVFDANQVDDPCEILDGEQLLVVCEPEQWREALAQCEQELRRALRFGFDEAELAEVRADALRALDEAVEREPTRASEGFVDEIVSAAEYAIVPSDAATDREILAPAYHSATLEQCRLALEVGWSRGTLTIYGAGNLDLGENAGERLRETWESSNAVELAAPAKIELGAWAYASAERGGALAKRVRSDELGLEQLEFENGVRVAIKATDFKQGQVFAWASLGEGELSLEPNRAALSFAANQVVTACGLQAHSSDDLRRLNAGKQAGAYFSVDSDQFHLGGATNADDLARQCELMCAQLSHPGWRDEGLRELRDWVPQMYGELERTAAGPQQLQFMPALYGGDSRFGTPPRAQVEAVELDALEDWLAPHLASAPLSVCLIGDLEVERAVEIAARTFGALPRRRAADPHTERRKLAGPKTGLKASYTIDTDVERSTVLIAFPTADGRDPALRAALDLLGDVVADRLMQQVREKLGASYAPSASSQTSKVFPGDGVLWMHAECDPHKVDALLEACYAVTDELARDGVPADDIDRARDPKLNHLRDALRTNDYWMQAIIESLHTRPTALNELRQVIETYRAVTPDYVSKLAQHYLTRERASQCVVSPKGP